MGLYIDDLWTSNYGPSNSLEHFLYDQETHQWFETYLCLSIKDSKNSNENKFIFKFYFLILILFQTLFKNIMRQQCPWMPNAKQDKQEKSTVSILKV